MSVWVTVARVEDAGTGADSCVLVVAIAKSCICYILRLGSATCNNLRNYMRNSSA